MSAYFILTETFGTKHAQHEKKQKPFHTRHRSIYIINKIKSITYIQF